MQNNNLSPNKKDLLEYIFGSRNAVNTSIEGDNYGFKSQRWEDIENVLQALLNGWLATHVTEKAMKDKLFACMLNWEDDYTKVKEYFISNVRVQIDYEHQKSPVKYTDVIAAHASMFRPWGHDSNYRISIIATNSYVKKAEGTYRTRAINCLGSIHVKRKTSCCGMATITMLNTGGLPKVGTLLTAMAKIVSFTQRYNAINITNIAARSRMDVLERFNIVSNLNWINQRTRKELFLASANFLDLKTQTGLAEQIKFLIGARTYKQTLNYLKNFKDLDEMAKAPSIGNLETPTNNSVKASFSNVEGYGDKFCSFSENPWKSDLTKYVKSVSKGKVEADDFPGIQVIRIGNLDNSYRYMAKKLVLPKGKKKKLQA